jgi:hypothetical protein
MAPSGGVYIGYLRLRHMKYRVKEVYDAGLKWYYPQYKNFFFWRNFEEWYRGVKWMRRWEPFFKTQSEAEHFLKKIRG